MDTIAIQWKFVGLIELHSETKQDTMKQGEGLSGERLSGESQKHSYTANSKTNNNLIFVQSTHSTFTNKSLMSAIFVWNRSKNPQPPIFFILH